MSYSLTYHLFDGESRRFRSPKVPTSSQLPLDRSTLLVAIELAGHVAYYEVDLAGLQTKLARSGGRSSELEPLAEVRPLPLLWYVFTIR